MKVRLIKIIMLHTILITITMVHNESIIKIITVYMIALKLEPK